MYRIKFEANDKNCQTTYSNDKSSESAKLCFPLNIAYIDYKWTYGIARKRRRNEKNENFTVW